MNLLVGETDQTAKNVRQALGLFSEEWDTCGYCDCRLTGSRFDRIVVLGSHDLEMSETEKDNLIEWLESLNIRLTLGGELVVA